MHYANSILNKLLNIRRIQHQIHISVGCACTNIFRTISSPLCSTPTGTNLNLMIYCFEHTKAYCYGKLRFIGAILLKKKPFTLIRAWYSSFNLCTQSSLSLGPAFVWRSGMLLSVLRVLSSTIVLQKK